MALQCIKSAIDKISSRIESLLSVIVKLFIKILSSKSDCKHLYQINCSPLNKLCIKITNAKYYHSSIIKLKIIKMRKLGFITPQGLKHLHLYHYQSGKYTWLDNALQPYWNYVLTLLPLTIAPNLLTLIGWLFLLSATLIMLSYDFTFKQTLPSWCFYYAAFCMWAYSTLDSIDGKQARRTKSSSPLGQLFDHGCDAFSVLFLIIQIGATCQLEYQQVFMIFMAAYIAFWFANWHEYRTGVLYTNIGQFGVTECQLLVAIIYILTGIFGQSFWKISLGQLLLPSLQAKVSHKLLISVLDMKIGGALSYYVGILVIILSLFEFVKTVAKERKLKPVMECFSLFVINPLFCFWIRFSFIESFIGVVLFGFGMLMSLLVCKIIISSVTRMELKVFHQETYILIVATFLMAVCQYFGWFQAQIIVFWAYMAAMLIACWLFLSNTISQLSNYLGIYCFSLSKRPQKSNIQYANRCQSNK